jgi:hypothetical protein
MPNELNVNITVDQLDLVGPVIAGEILNAYYSALLLKQQKGIEITTEIEQETLAEVVRIWSKIQILLKESAQKKPTPPETS